MTPSHYILADKGDLIQLVAVLVIVGISAIGRKIGQRVQRQAQQAREGGAAEAPPPRQTVVPSRQPSPPRPPRGMPPRPDQALAMAFRRQLGLPPQDLAPDLSRQAETPVYQAVQPLEASAAGAEVEMEVQRERRRLDRDELRRRERLTARAPQEADTAGIVSRLLHIPQAQHAPLTETAAQLPSTQAGAQVSPAIQQLRQAVIWSEILSPPKALRLGRESWTI